MKEQFIEDFQKHILFASFIFIRGLIIVPAICIFMIVASIILRLAQYGHVWAEACK